MHLSRLFISNYRSIECADLHFNPGKNVIVGKNNAGKSNIIRAIDLLLGESSPDYSKSENITANDFHNGDLSRSISILAILDRAESDVLNYTEINKCWGYHVRGRCDWAVVAGEKSKVPVSIQAERVSLDETNNVQLLSDIDSILGIDFEEVAKVYINPKLKSKSAFREQLEPMFQFAYLFSARFDVSTKRVVKEVRFLYRESEGEEWVLTSSARVRNELLQSAIIPAFRDPQNQLRINNYGWYGKLLQHHIDSNNQDLKKAFLKVKSVSKKIFEVLHSKVNDGRVKVAFPDTDITFQFNPDAKQDIYKNTLIYVNDGFSSQLQEKGSGIQSVVIIGLFDFYVRNIAHVSSSLLAVEEPELYLHPHGRRIMSNRLEDFLDGGKNQVIITTHAPEFIGSPSSTLHVNLVKKISGKTVVKSTTFNTPEDKRILMKSQNTEMFFADGVILVEGGEKYIFEKVAKMYGRKRKSLGENWLDNKNISMISVGGKDEFVKYSIRLKELGIPWIVFADFDFLRRGLAEFLTKIEGTPANLINKLNAIKSKIAAGIGAGTMYKKISQAPMMYRSEIVALLNELHTEGVYIFSGELEDMYKPSSSAICVGIEGKEGKAIQIASSMEGAREKVYIFTKEIERAFDVFLAQLETRK